MPVLPEAGVVKSKMAELNYIFVDNLGLVTYRFVLPDGDVREFDDLEEGIRFAAANEVCEVGVVFPDGDVQWIPHKPEGGGVG